MESKEITRWQDQTALERFQMIAPLIGEGLDPAKRAELRRQAAQRNGISERTLRRYETAYQKAQFEGLKPVRRVADKIRGPFPGFDRVLEYVATRTVYVRQIYTTLKEYHIHLVAVSDSLEQINYMAKIIKKACIDDIVEYHARQVREIIKDVYGGIEYERRSESGTVTDNRADNRGSCT